MRAILERRILTTPAGTTVTATAAGPSSTRPYSEDNRTVLSLQFEDELGGPASVILGAGETAALAHVLKAADASNESVSETAARLLEKHAGVLSDTLIAELKAAL